MHSEEPRPLRVAGQPKWVSRVVVDAIHTSLIQQYGGVHGIRDVGLLESALSRSQNRLLYEPDTDLAELAAAYGVRIAKNDAFIDGRKRTAYQVMFVFLGLNGYRITASEPAVVSLMIGVATGDIDEDALTRWCRMNTSAW